jgi:protein tyrosine/serine phosphatase
MRHLLRAMTLAAIAAALVTTGGCAPKAIGLEKRDGPRSARAVDVSTITIRNVAAVNANYYRGGQPEDGDYGALAALGIRTVISLRKERPDDQEARLVEAAGMSFHRIPMHTRVAPTLEQVAEFMTMVSHPAYQPIYVHCAGGKHRTGVMTAVYRMEHDGWTADQAYQEMKQYDFGQSLLHPELKQYVYRYQPLRTYGSVARP